MYLLEKAFNAKFGITRVHDRLVLHKNLLGTETERGKHEAMLTAYYRASGQDIDTGIPTCERLEAVGLAFVVDVLEGLLPVPAWDGSPPWPLDVYPRGQHRV